MLTTFLYTLNCPATGKIKYLGKSNQPFARLKSHIRLAKQSRSHKNSWILGLRTQGLNPVIEVLDEIPVAEWQFWEREYIRVFRAIGIKLTNGTDGGDGNLGGKASPTTRRKMSDSRKGRTQPVEVREKISAALKGRPRTPEVCERLSISHIGKFHTQRTRDKMSISRTGKACVQITRVKISRSMRGRKEGLICNRIQTTLSQCVTNS